MGSVYTSMSNHPTSLAGVIIVNVIETGFCQMQNTLTIIPIRPLLLEESTVWTDQWVIIFHRCTMSMDCCL